jgi:hypothetical protein
MNNHVLFVSKKVKRKSKPFAPLANQYNLNLSNASPYEKLADRIQASKIEKAVLDAIESLKARLAGQQYQQEHFGEMKLIDPDLVDINIDIQRLLENLHIGKDIIELFDPRIVQPINVIFIKSTGRYSCWDGQQSAASLALMMHFGLIAPGVKIQCKVFDDDLAVPGSKLVGEAVGNFGFRCLNGNGRQPVEEFFTHRSRVNGVRRYGSDLEEDKQSDEIQQILEKNNMFPAPQSDARNGRALPGMVTYISGINKIAGHGTSRDLFDITKQDLDWALHWHNRYFPNEKGIDGGFILAFGRLHAESRGAPATKDEPAIPKVQITRELEDGLALMIKEKYLTPGGFHENCKKRLKDWHIENGMRSSWSDRCLTPFLVLDYLEWGKCQAAIPQVSGLGIYSGV